MQQNESLHIFRVFNFVCSSFIQSVDDRTHTHTRFIEHSLQISLFDSSTKQRKVLRAQVKPKQKQNKSKAKAKESSGEKWREKLPSIIYYRVRPFAIYYLFYWLFFFVSCCMIAYERREITTWWSREQTDPKKTFSLDCYTKAYVKLMQWTMLERASTTYNQGTVSDYSCVTNSNWFGVCKQVFVRQNAPFKCFSE